MAFIHKKRVHYKGRSEFEHCKTNLLQPLTRAEIHLTLRKSKYCFWDCCIAFGIVELLSFYPRKRSEESNIIEDLCDREWQGFNGCIAFMTPTFLYPSGHAIT